MKKRNFRTVDCALIVAMVMFAGIAGAGFANRISGIDKLRDTNASLFLRVLDLEARQSKLGYEFDNYTEHAPTLEYQFSTDGKNWSDFTEYIHYHWPAKARKRMAVTVESETEYFSIK